MKSVLVDEDMIRGFPGRLFDFLCKLLDINVTIGDTTWEAFDSEKIACLANFFVVQKKN